MRSSRLVSTMLSLGMGLWVCWSGASASWPMFQKGATHPGRTGHDGAESNYTEWTFQITRPDSWGSRPMVWSSPVIEDGKVYVCTRHGYLYCFNLSDGDSLWAVQVADTI
jgi:outer membrane protein assembly factor BamB